MNVLSVVNFLDFKAELKSCFTYVKECVLKSTRKDSSELFVCAQLHQTIS